MRFAFLVGMKATKRVEGVMSWNAVAMIILLLPVGAVQAQSRGSERAEAKSSTKVEESRQRGVSRVSGSVKSKARERSEATRSERTPRKATRSERAEKPKETRRANAVDTRDKARERSRSQQPGRSAETRRTNELNTPDKPNRTVKPNKPVKPSESNRTHRPNKPSEPSKPHKPEVRHDKPNSHGHWHPPIGHRDHHPKPIRRSRFWWHFHPRHTHHRADVGIGFYIKLPVIGWFVGPPRRRFVFRQIVYANGFRDGYVNAGVDIRTTFERRISRVYDDRTVIDFEVRSIEIWDGPRFLGVVDHLPGRLRRVRATVYRDGFVDFDRMIYVVGDLSRGFELVSLRYHGLGPNAAYVDLDVRVGVIDFRRREVQSVDYSRNLAWLDAGLVPSALIPQDDDSGLRFVLEGEGSRYAHTYTLGSLSNPNQGLETREITLSRID